MGSLVAYIRPLFRHLGWGIVLSTLAFVNGYPLVYADSGAYVRASITLEQLDDRPLGYSLFLRAITWQETLWTVPIVQGALVSWLLLVLLRALVDRQVDIHRKHNILKAFLGVGTSLPWYTAQIMADIFTPVLFLSTYVITSRLALRWPALIFVHLVVLLGLISHNSHILILLAAWSTWTIVMGSIGPGLGTWSGWRVLTPPLLALIAPVFIGGFYMMDGKAPALSRAGNVFLAGRLCEEGVMERFLREHCAEREYRLCPYVDDLPADAGMMLWSDKGLLAREGLSLSQADSVLAPLMKDILKDPVAMRTYARSVLVSALVQMFQFDAGVGLHGYGPGTSPFFHIGNHFPREFSRYRMSRQQRDEFKVLERANWLVALVLVLSCIYLLFSFLRWIRLPRFRALFIAIVAWLVANAAVTSALAVVDPRLQSRVLWLIPMFAVLVFVEHPWWSGKGVTFSFGRERGGYSTQSR